MNCKYCGNLITGEGKKFCSRDCFFASIKKDKKFCVVCGEDITKKKGKKYCSMQCSGIGSRKDLLKFKCPQCGIAFERKTKGEGKRQFCSSVCSNRYNNKEDKTKKKEYTCKFCKNKFIDWVYRNTIFCSNICKSKYGARQPKPKARKPESFVTKSCEVCNKKYTVHKIFTEKRNSRFCSKECRAVQKSIDMTGEGNHNYIPPHLRAKPIKYGKNWKSQSSKARKRDNYTCQKCGDVWSKDKYDKKFHVHHIVSVREFDDYRDANKLNNLVTLCPSCHRKIHYECSC